MALTEKLKNIANAIRSKTNKTEELTLEQMADEVSNIYSPKAEEVRKVTIDENGTVIVSPSEGNDVMKEVEVNVRVNGYDNGYDFTTIGYTKDVNDEINSYYAESLSVAKEIMDNWDENNTTCVFDDSNIIYFPMLKTPNVKKFSFWQCENLEGMPEDFDVSTATDLVQCWHECKLLRRLPNVVDLRNLKTCNRTLNNIPKLEKMPSVVNTNNIEIFEFSFSNLFLIVDFSINTDSATIFSGTFYNSYFKSIILTSVRNATFSSEHGTFYNNKQLEKLNFTEWKQSDVLLAQSNKLTSESVKYIIWHAMNGENTLDFENQGATSRILTLHATPYNSWNTWKLTKPSIEDCEFLGIDETEITKYGELTWEDIALNVKLITIAK